MTILAKSHVEFTVFQHLREETMLLGQSMDKMKISLNSDTNLQLSDSDVIPYHDLRQESDQMRLTNLRGNHFHFPQLRQATRYKLEGTGIESRWW